MTRIQYKLDFKIRLRFKNIYFLFFSKDVLNSFKKLFNLVFGQNLFINALKFFDDLKNFILTCDISEKYLLFDF